MKLKKKSIFQVLVAACQLVYLLGQCICGIFALVHMQLYCHSKYCVLETPVLWPDWKWRWSSRLEKKACMVKSHGYSQIRASGFCSWSTTFILFTSHAWYNDQQLVAFCTCVLKLYYLFFHFVCISGPISCTSSDFQCLADKKHCRCRHTHAYQYTTYFIRLVSSHIFIVYDEWIGEQRGELGN